MHIDRAALQNALLGFLADKDDAVIDLTCDLVRAPSPNPPGDETAPVAVAQAAIHGLGLPQARVLAKEPHRPNLVVRIDGSLPGPHLALCGHLDTKPVGDAARLWRSDPLVPTFDGDRLYGLGSTDMKGACAAMIYAGAAFHANRDRMPGSLSLVFTSDEEYGSNYGAKYLADHRLIECDAMILGEPSGVRDEWDAIRIVSRGISCFVVRVFGTQTHSSISDTLPTINAVDAMAQLMVGFRREFKPRFPPHPLCPTGPTINIGVRCAGGVGYGVLPGQAEFATDVRTTPGMTREVFEADVNAALARAAKDLHPGARYEVTYHPGLDWVPATEVAADDRVTVACQRAAEAVLGSVPPLAQFPGGTDAYPFQLTGGIPTLCSFGPGQLPLAHGANEWVSVTSVKQAMRMYALVALEFCSGI